MFIGRTWLLFFQFLFNSHLCAWHKHVHCHTHTHTAWRSIKYCCGSLILAGPLQEPEGHLVPTGQRSILLQSDRHWSGTPLPLAVHVCGPDWMTAMMTQSFLWVACFSKVTALPPHPSWTDLREMLSGLEARLSSSVPGRWCRYLTAVQHGMVLGSRAELPFTGGSARARG